MIADRDATLARSYGAKPTDPEPEALRHIRTLEITNAVLAVIAVVVTHLLAGDGPLLWGVVAGAAVNVLNLRSMVWLGRRVTRAGHRSKKFYAALFAAKLAAILVVCWAVLTYLPILPLGFVLGFSTLMPATLVLALKKGLEPVTPARHGEHKP